MLLIHGGSSTTGHIEFISVYGATSTMTHNIDMVDIYANSRLKMAPRVAFRWNWNMIQAEYLSCGIALHENLAKMKLTMEREEQSF